MSDPIISLGTNCEIAYNIRHTFQSERAYPFDWWITPLQSVAAIVRERFTLDMTERNLAHVNAPESVLNLKYGILHHHDFPRDANECVRGEWAAHIPAIAEKYKALSARFFEDIGQAQRALLIVNGPGTHRAYTSPVPLDENVYLDLAATLRAVFPRTRITLGVFNAQSDPTEGALKAAREDASIIVAPAVKDYGDRAPRAKFAMSLQAWTEALTAMRAAAFA